MADEEQLYGYELEQVKGVAQDLAHGDAKLIDDGKDFAGNDKVKSTMRRYIGVPERKPRTEAAGFGHADASPVMQQVATPTSTPSPTPTMPAVKQAVQMPEHSRIETSSASPRGEIK
mmetsp:Transcript_22742/g.55547  ORF Transcript_22742/g.55547 Transcript_22742/m.55547 type:complete len:117 (-) Transcript_22742:242-592(-)